jgi:hypothetical protein
MVVLLRVDNFLPEGAGGGFLEDVGYDAVGPLAGEGGFGGAEEKVLVGKAEGASVVISTTSGTKGVDRPV